MTIVYLLKNQHNQFLEKSGEWVDSGHPRILFRTEYKDVAVNQKVEFSVKHPELRITITEAQLDEHGAPRIDEPTAITPLNKGADFNLQQSANCDDVQSTSADIDTHREVPIQAKY